MNIEQGEDIELLAGANESGRNVVGCKHDVARGTERVCKIKLIKGGVGRTINKPDLMSGKLRLMERGKTGRILLSGNLATILAGRLHSSGVESSPV